MLLIFPEFLSSALFLYSIPHRTHISLRSPEALLGCDKSRLACFDNFDSLGDPGQVFCRMFFCWILWNAFLKIQLELWVWGMKPQ